MTLQIAGYIVGALCFGALAGFVAGFFVMRNNPSLFDIDEMLKGKRDEIIDGVKKQGDAITDRVQAKIGELNKRIDEIQRR